MTPQKLLLVFVALVVSCQGLNKFKVLHSWDTVDYHWPSHHPNATRQVMVKLGLFIPGNSIIFDVDWWNGRVFVTTPRLKPGVPASLSTVSPYGDELNPVLHPYPNWSWHRPGDCEGITSVSSIQFDPCGRLWVLDSGMINIETDHPERICPPKMFIFQMSSNTLVSTHNFTSKLFKSTSRVSSFVIDVRSNASNCASTFAYITDSSTSGLIVHDNHRKQSWRIEANNFYAIPSFGGFNVAGVEYNSMAGIQALALAPNSTTRRLYYHSFASNTENYVLTSVLRNQTRFRTGVLSTDTQKEFTTFTNKRDGQATSMGITSKGLMFYGNLPTSSINCWNTANDYSAANLVEMEKDDNLLQYPASLKVVKRTDGTEEIWVLSNHYHKYKTNQFERGHVKYRIMAASVDELLKGKAC